MGGGGDLVAYFILMNQHSNLSGWVGQWWTQSIFSTCAPPPPGPFTLFERQAERDTHRGKESFYPPVHSANACNFQDWARPSYEPGLAWSSTWVALEPSLLLPRVCVSRELQPKQSNPHSNRALWEGMWVSQVTIWACCAQRPPLQCLLMDNQTMIS